MREAENCAWNGNGTRSVQPPPLKSGYRASSLDIGSKFGRHDMFKCYSRRTCIGWGPSYELNAYDDAFDDFQCVDGRGGRACSLCLPGLTGGPDGACGKSGDPETHRSHLVAIVTASLAFLALCMQFFSDKKRRKLTKLLRRLRLLAKQSIKHLQMLSVLANISTDWPAEVLIVMRAINILNLDARLQVSCLLELWSTTRAMVCKWLLNLMAYVYAAQEQREHCWANGCCHRSFCFFTISAVFSAVTLRASAELQE